MAKKRVLIYPCGTEIALEMWESLRYSKHFEPIGANDVPCAWPGPYAICPREHLPSYAYEKGVDLFLPAHDEVIEWAALNAGLFQCQVVTHPLETVQVCRSKKATYARFPAISPKQVDEYPMFIKPDKGYGSKRAQICLHEEDLTRYIGLAEEFDDFVKMEILVGQEITVDCFTNSDGVLIFEAARARNIVRGGISVNTHHVLSLQNNGFGEKINDYLAFSGAWFYQVKAGKLLEIGTRISGSSGYWRGHGFNLTEATLFQDIGVNVWFPARWISLNSSNETFRRLSTRLTGLEFDTVYVDYDDTIMVDGKPLPELVGLLYKWHNEGKKIVIVSRNVQDDPPFFLLDIQPDYIHCPRPEPKSRHVKPGGIFIDDSFTEREDVRENAGVPVFGLEALAMLW